MTLYVPGGTENTIKDTYLRQFWSESCGYSGWCGRFQLFAPPGWHADPTFKETGYCCGGHGGCSNCIMTLSQAIADYSTEVTFVSDPPGAQIFIDGVEWWQGAITGADGATFRGISPGTHTYELRMAGYQSVTGTFVLALDTPITLLPPTGSASFSSIPSGAEIFLDGADQSIKTPATITDVPAGSHTYTLKLSGYNDFAGTVEVIKDQTVSVSAVLVPSEGCILFSTVPAGAKVIVDGTDTGKITPALICGLSIGQHTYRLSLAGYLESSGSVELAAGQGTKVTITLEKKFGSISFASTPSGAQVFLDGQDQEMVTPATLTNVPTGSHAFTLKLAGYNDYTGIVEVLENQISTVTATLTPAEGCIYFNTTPAGAKIFIDDVDTGQVTPALVCGLTLGAHTYRLSLTGYQDITGSVDLVAGQGTTVTGTLPKKGIGTGTIIVLTLLGAGVLGAVILGSGEKTTIVNREFTRRPPGGR